MILLRFLLNFMLFGVLFFLIWHFFPEVFTRLVEWAAIIVDFFQKLFAELFNKAQDATKDSKEEIKTAVIFFLSR